MIEAKYFIAKRGVESANRRVDEKFIRKIVGNKNLKKVISLLESGMVVITKKYVIRLDKNLST